ncbi:hypothetical protein Hanom_Chr01g00079151 [Helianthus anomalus]
MQPPSVGSSLVAMSASQALGIERRFVVLLLYKTGAGWVLKGKGPRCVYSMIMINKANGERFSILPPLYGMIPEEVTGINETQPFEDLSV